MGLLTWIKEKLSKSNKVSFTSLEKDYILKCPNCGSTNLGYLTSLANIVQVVNGTESPKYVNTVVCAKCNFRAVGEIDDDSNEYLKELVWEKRN